MPTVDYRLRALKDWKTRRRKAAIYRARALKGWETRRRKLRSERAKRGWETRRLREMERRREAERRRERALRGWETRRRREEEKRRRERALKGWETRRYRKRQAAGRAAWETRQKRYEERLRQITVDAAGNYHGPDGRLIPVPRPHYRCDARGRWWRWDFRAKRWRIAKKPVPSEIHEEPRGTVQDGRLISKEPAVTLVAPTELRFLESFAKFDERIAWRDIKVMPVTAAQLDKISPDKRYHCKIEADPKTRLTALRYFESVDEADDWYTALAREMNNVSLENRWRVDYTVWESERGKHVGKIELIVHEIYPQRFAASGIVLRERLRLLHERIGEYEYLRVSIHELGKKKAAKPKKKASCRV